MQSNKFIDFIITQKCTYSCAYCSQSKNQTKQKNSASKTTIDNFLNFLDNLDGDFEITITGGEAMLHPEFIYLINEIKQKNFKINLVTNFSFDIEKYIQVFDILGNSLNKYDISFHLAELSKTYPDINILFKKLKTFLSLKPECTVVKFFIPVFDINKEKEDLIDSIVSFANENNISYSFQKIRFLNKKIISFNSEKYFKDNDDETINPYGYLCYSGNKSAVIYENGEVYRCYSSRFCKTNYLGNINNKNFHLNQNPMPCVFKTCNCDKPLLYNQLTNEKQKPKADFMSFYNLICLPYLIFKNRKTVKNKIKQYFDIK